MNVAPPQTPFTIRFARQGDRLFSLTAAFASPAFQNVASQKDAPVAGASTNRASPASRLRTARIA